MASAPDITTGAGMRPTRARAILAAALAAGCALAAPARGQELRLPTILRPSSVTPEIIDGPNPDRLRRPPPAPALLPRTRVAPPNPTRRLVRPAAPGAEAALKVDSSPLRRLGPPALTSPPPAPRPRRTDPDPWAATGLRLGGFTIRPALDLDAGYDTNPNRLRGGAKGSSFLRPGAEIAIDSNWPTHSFQGLLRGSYSAYGSVESANRPEAEARGDWRFDVTRSTQAVAQARFRLDTQSPQTTNLPFLTASRPLTWQYGATLGADHTINRLTFGLRGLFDRFTFDDAPLPGGGSVDQRDRNYNQPGATLRASYELTPSVRPFIEGKIDARLHDRRIDDSGFERNSTGVGARVGTTLDVRRTLTGEASVGYEQRRYSDSRLADLRGMVGDVSLIWSATPLTRIGLRGQTTLDETTVPGVSGVVTRKATVEIAHAFLRNLTLTASGTFQRADYRGAALTEDTLTGTVRLDYKLSRTVAVRASYSHERLRSTAPGADYTANIFMVGLRLQR